MCKGQYRPKLQYTNTRTLWWVYIVIIKSYQVNHAIKQREKGGKKKTEILNGHHLEISTKRHHFVSCVINFKTIKHQVCQNLQICAWLRRLIVHALREILRYENKNVSTSNNSSQMTIIFSFNKYKVCNTLCL